MLLYIFIYIEFENHTFLIDTVDILPYYGIICYR